MEQIIYFLEIFTLLRYHKYKVTNVFSIFFILVHAFLKKFFKFLIIILFVEQT